MCADETTVEDRDEQQTRNLMTAIERLPLHYASLDRNVDQTFASDAKAGFFLALHIVMISTSATRLAAITEIFDKGDVTFSAVAIVGLAVVSLLANVIAIALATAVVYPRLSKANSEIIYFGSIAASEYPTFEERARGMSGEEHERDVLRQIHVVSRIVLKKITLLRRVAFLTVIAGVTWISFIFATT